MTALPFSPLLAQFAAEPKGPATFLLLGLVLCAGGLLFLFWLWMLLDCISISPASSDYASRTTWIVLLLLVGWIGALLYFFMVRRPRLGRRRARHGRTRAHRSSLQATSSVPPR